MELYICSCTATLADAVLSVLNMKKRFALLFILSLIAYLAPAQDTLPRFTVKNLGSNRIVISWINRFQDVKQINIQRSFDSLKNYKTILSVADPSSPENGFVDTKANNDRMFYRIYIQLDKGVFLFSDPKRPVWDTSNYTTTRPQKAENVRTITTPLFSQDSVSNVPVLATDNRPKADRWKPSPFVFTSKEGYIRVTLPDDESKHYSLKVLTLDNDLLFELKDIRQRSFRIDKSNFYSSGWFNFELYENGELKEKNKFFLPKEF